MKLATRINDVKEGDMRPRNYSPCELLLRKITMESEKERQAENHTCKGRYCTVKKAESNSIIFPTEYQESFFQHPWSTYSPIRRAAVLLLPFPCPTPKRSGRFTPQHLASARLSFSLFNPADPIRSHHILSRLNTCCPPLRTRTARHCAA